MQDWLFEWRRFRYARLVSKQLNKAYQMDEQWLSPALKVQEKHLIQNPFSKNCGPFIYPSFRLDGVGIQVLIRIACMALAKQKGAHYIHIPFVRIEHREIDPVGRQMTDLEWAMTWENFFNFGKNETLLKTAVHTLGKARLVSLFTDKKSRFGDPHAESNVQIGVDSLQRNTNGHFVFNLGLCKFFTDNHLVLSEQLLADLRARISPFSPDESTLPYFSGAQHIAVHIRRGDVWDQVQKGSTATRFTNKLVGEAYYIDLLRKWNKAWKKETNEPLHFHIYSDGVPENFPGFRFKEEGLAEIPADDQWEKVDNIHMYLRASTTFTMYALIYAPVLLPGKSSFGAVAAMLGEGKLVKDPEIFEFYPYKMLITSEGAAKRLISSSELIRELLTDGNKR